MPPTILVVGSLHYDIMVEADHLPRRDETAVGSRWYPKFGGKGGNQAVSAARAGGHVRMLGAVGDDGFGAFLRAGLTAEGVDASLVATLPGEASGMSVAITDASGDYAATIVSGANLRIDAAWLSADATWDGVDMLVLQNEVPEEVNIAAALAARARRVPVLLNAAPARALTTDLSRRIDVLVVNAVEAEMMGAAPVTSLGGAAAAAQVLAGHFPTVVVTAGGLGLAAVSGTNAPFQLAAEPVTVVSSHGAGDCFAGTLAVGLARGASVAEACTTAAHAAALHVSTRTDIQARTRKGA